MASMPYFLAIDAGGTTTTCLLAESDADETHILARASTTSIKLQRVSESEATARLTALLHDVATAASIPLTQITRTCIGLAGLSIPAVRAHASRTLSALVSGEILILGDEEIALDAAFPSTPGILLIAGTGSNCIGRDAAGSLHRAGGYGPILGDEGGGYWIGLESLRAALRALDSDQSDPQHPGADQLGAPPMTVSPSWVRYRSQQRTTALDLNSTHATTLLTEIQHHFNISTLPELIELGNRRTAPVPDFASLAPVIAHADVSGNPIAAATLHRAGELLAHLVTTVAQKITSTPTASNPEPHTSPLEVAFAGSILTEIPAVHTAFAAQLAQILPNAHIRPTPIDPLLGALHRARHA
jgi:glucosamine kinase